MGKNQYFSHVLTKRSQQYICFVFFCLALLGCAQQNEAPFPYDLNGYRVAKQDSLPQLPWVTIGEPDSLGRVKFKTQPFFIDQLPKRRFNSIQTRAVADFKQKAISWDVQPLDAGGLKPDTLEVAVTRKLVPTPVVSRLEPPKILKNTTSGFLQWSEEEGLANNSVTAMTVDKQGTRWFATAAGLSRMTNDGTLTYTITANTQNGAPFPIMSMAVGPDNRLWLASCGNGIYVLDPLRDSMTHYADNRCFLFMFIDSKNELWVGALNNQLIRADLQYANRKFISGVDQAVSGMEDKAGRLWIGSREKITLIDAERKTRKTVGKENGFQPNVAIRLVEDNDLNVWVCNFAKGLYKLDAEHNQVTYIDSAMGISSSIIDIQQDDSNDLWLMSRDSVFRYNRSQQSLRSFYTGARLINQLKTESGIDHQGIIWMGTLDKGLLLIDTRGPLPENLDSTAGLTNLNTWGTLDDSAQHRIWVGTKKGLNIIDYSSGTVRYLITGDLMKDNIRRVSSLGNNDIFFATDNGLFLYDSTRQTLTSYDFPPSTNYFYPMEAVRNHDDEVFVNTISGLIRLNIRNGYYHRFAAKQNLPSSLIWNMKRASTGDTWLGTDSGLAQMSADRTRVRTYRKQHGLLSDIVYRVLEMPDGKIAAAMVGGVSVIDPKKNTIISIPLKQGPISAQIFDMVCYKGLLYAGSQDGLFVIDLDASGSKYRVTRYGKRQGFLYNDYNQGAGIATANGQIWFGISPVTTVVTQPPFIDTVATSVEITNIRIKDALPDFRNLNRSRSADLDSVSGVDDVSVFKQIDGIHWDSLTGKHHLPVGLEMEHDVNAISFNFTSTDLRSRENTMYSYRLQGVDTGWSASSPRPFSRTYFNLSPGRYTLKVRAKGFYGTWSPEAEFAFEIRIPWWRSWWALTLFALSFAFLAWLVAGYRARMLKKENVLLEQRVNERTVALQHSIQELKTTQAQMIQREKMASLGELTAGIAHEIQNPLNFVNNFSEVNQELLTDLKDEINKGDEKAINELLDDLHSNNVKINQHGKRADSIIKSMLQHSRTSSGDKELTDLNALCEEYLQLSYHGMRAKEKDFNVKIHSNLAEGLPQVKMVPQDIGRVLMNLLNNAFYATRKSKKFGQPGYEPQVSLSTALQDRVVTISVSDNGDGIPAELMKKIFQPFFTTKPTGEGTGLGLSLSFDIITKGHGGQLQVQTEPGVGTTFIISLLAA